jgi:alkaline phosphatase D
LQFINNYAGQSNDVPPFANADDAFRIHHTDGNYELRVPGQHYYDSVMVMWHFS